MPDIQLFYKESIESLRFRLDEQESKHLIRVLRKSAGDEVFFTDGHGKLVRGTILEDNPKRAIVEVVEEIQYKEKLGRLSVAIAPTKNLDRMEYFAEKATEIGIGAIFPVICDRSERKVLKNERIQKIVISAMKQSLKYFLPKVYEAMPFADLMSEDFPQKFIAHLDEDNPGPAFQDAILADQDALLLVGPEGDFTPNELALAKENGFVQVTLGSSRLRTETAGVVAATLWNL
ncbi:MAG: 16S rRNA (uracil1498-N3)-methyltransferase [Flavobacteriales bacterium]|jgi:16S rRNA (uracil1498-N3)-methyltransferase